MKKVFVLLLFVLIIISCENNKKNQNLKQNKPENIVPTPKINFSVLPAKVLKFDSKFKIAYEINFSEKIDSVFLNFETEKLKLDKNQDTLEFNAKDFGQGQHMLTLEVFYNGRVKRAEDKFVVLAEKKPVIYTYKVIKSFPHDRNAYTQGLVFADGIFYESTGLEKRSSIRKVDVETGDVLYSYDLPENYFGEGIALLNDKLYQITWQNGTAFVFDKNTFEKIEEFRYTTEGWGLTTDGNLLYMSDGSSKIYIRDPQTFGLINSFYVYDDRKLVKLLNELEYINGKIWANIYTTDLIAIIDPQTGAVEAYIDCSGILPAKFRDRNTDVLNGIAYDKDNNRIFITGKNWARLFQIDTVKKSGM